MTRRLLILFSATIIFVLLGTAPAKGDPPPYQSELVCKDNLGQVIAAKGFTILQPNGDLYVRVQGLPGSGTVSCQIQCFFSGGFSTSSNCGGRAIGAGGNLTTIAPAESFVPPLSGTCEGPVVQVFPAGSFFCRSGFTR